MNQKQKALRKVQQYEFVVVELNEYLDTHPEDMQAVREMEKYVKLAKDAHDAYVKQYGCPLWVEEATAENGKWNWVSDPWPWELQEVE